MLREWRHLTVARCCDSTMHSNPWSWVEPSRQAKLRLFWRARMCLSYITRQIDVYIVLLSSYRRWTASGKYPTTRRYAEPKNQNSAKCEIRLDSSRRISYTLAETLQAIWYISQSAKKKKKKIERETVTTISTVYSLAALAICFRKRGFATSSRVFQWSMNTGRWSDNVSSADCICTYSR